MRKLEIGQPFNPRGLFSGTFIPDAIMKYNKITLSAKVLLCRLYRYSHKDGCAYPTQEKLAKDLMLSVSQVQRLIKNLVEEGFIAIERSAEDKLQHSPNKYVPLWHEAFEIYEEEDEEEGADDDDSTRQNEVSQPRVDAVSQPRADAVSNIKHNLLKHKEKEKEKINKKEKEKDFLREYPEELNKQEFINIWEEWIKHRKEIKQPLTHTSVKKQFAFLKELGAEKAIESVEQSIINGWQGLFKPKNNGQSNTGWREEYEKELKQSQQDPFEQLKQQLKQGE